MGEPTLHPKLNEILEYAKNKNVKISLTTNGSTLVKKRIPNLLDSISGKIVASLMTPTKDSYKIRGDVGLSWDRYIGNFQLIQGKMADMYSTWSACRAYCYAVAASCDRGNTTRKDSAGCILYSAEKATWMALEAIQTLGGNGYVNEYPTGRLLRDAKLYEIGAGTSEIRRILIGRELFKETT